MILLMVDVEEEGHYKWISFNNKFEIIERGIWNKEKNILEIPHQKIDGIFLGLPRSLFVGKEIELPPLSYENIKEALSYKVPKLFYFKENPFFTFLKSELDYSKVLVFVCSRDGLNNIIEKIEKIFQSKVVSVFFTGLAIANFILKEKQDNNFVLKYKREKGDEFIIIDENIVKSYLFITYDKEIKLNLYDKYKTIDIQWTDGDIFNKKFLKNLYQTFVKGKNGNLIASNLFPEKIKYLRTNSRYHTLVRYLFAISLIFFLLSPLIKTIRETTMLETKISELTPKIKRIKTLMREIENKKNKIRLIEKYFKYDLLDISSKISQTLPKGVNITYYHIDKHKVKIRGYAKKAADVINSLNKLRELSNVRFIESILKQRQDNEVLERFFIEADIAK